MGFRLEGVPNIPVEEGVLDDCCPKGDVLGAVAPNGDIDDDAVNGVVLVDAVELEFVKGVFVVDWEPKIGAATGGGVFDPNPCKFEGVENDVPKEGVEIWPKVDAGINEIMSYKI